MSFGVMTFGMKVAASVERECHDEERERKGSGRERKRGMQKQCECKIERNI